MLQKNDFGQKKFRISYMGSKVPFWQFFNFAKKNTVSMIRDVRRSENLRGLPPLVEIRLTLNNAGFQEKFFGEIKFVFSEFSFN